MSNLQADLAPNLATSDANALADQRILKHISFVVLGMMGIAIAIAITASSVA